MVNAKFRSTLSFPAARSPALLLRRTSGRSPTGVLGLPARAVVGPTQTLRNSVGNAAEEMGNLRLLVADDHEIVRKGVCRLLSEQPGWDVVGEAANGREAIELAKLLRPNITILDLAMPQVSGLEAAQEILKSVPTKILILTVYGSDSLVQQTLQAGAQAYVLKSDAGRDLVSAVDALRRNKTFFTPMVEEMVLEGFLGYSSKDREHDHTKKSLRLTARQTAILRLLVEGKTSKGISAALNISVKTAETHRGNIMRRLHCHSVTDLVRYAVRNHLIEP